MNKNIRLEIHKSNLPEIITQQTNVSRLVKPPASAFYVADRQIDRQTRPNTTLCSFCVDCRDRFTPWLSFSLANHAPRHKREINQILVVRGDKKNSRQSFITRILDPIESTVLHKKKFVCTTRHDLRLPQKWNFARMTHVVSSEPDCLRGLLNSFIGLSSSSDEFRSFIC